MIRFPTSRPNALANAFNKAIKDSSITTWEKDSDGDYFHKADQWTKRAWLRMTIVEKDTRQFFPDFLVWKDGLIFAIDPKGGHLLAKDAWKKLLDIRDEKGQRKILVRFISAGKWSDDLKHLGSTGFTVWSMTKTTGKLKAKVVNSVEDAVEAALKLS